jgi:hypothetical protein
LQAIADKPGQMVGLFSGVFKTFEDVVHGAGQVTQVVIGGAAETAHNAVGAAVEAGKVLSTVPFTFAIDHVGHESVILRTATGIFKEADDDSQRELINEVLRRAPGLIKPGTLLDAVKNLIPVIQLDKEAVTSALNLVQSSVDLVEPDLLLKAAKTITKGILNAFITTVRGLPFIKDGIFSNDVNAAILGLIWSQGATLAKFMIDLIEPAKGYVQANTLNGTTEQDDVRGKYNELDFSKATNRHAAICQLQRLAKSIIFILSKMTTAVDTNLNNINITNETRLAGDFRLGETITVAPRAETQVGPKEKWLFVNGIAGELFWLHLACKKLADRYSREVTGIFNRGDGILWDLIECAGERSAQGTGYAASQKRLVQRTMSSMRAQEILKHELEVALKDSGTAHIVMIAHSQGCLLLRLALEQLINADPKGQNGIRIAMLNRLCVFTFGNPSLDWKLEMNVDNPVQALKQNQGTMDLTHLTSHTHRTEHFANTEDFVATLGVLNRSPEERPDIGYPGSCVFINSENDWIGHLFGAQYSLDASHYKNSDGETSWLLTCNPGQPIWLQKCNSIDSNSRL